jgi:hypothetical protein
MTAASPDIRLLPHGIRLHGHNATLKRKPGQGVAALAGLVQ